MRRCDPGGHERRWEMGSWETRSCGRGKTRCGRSGEMPNCRSCESRGGEARSRGRREAGRDWSAEARSCRGRTHASEAAGPAGCRCHGASKGECHNSCDANARLPHGPNSHSPARSRCLWILFPPARAKPRAVARRSKNPRCVTSGAGSHSGCTQRPGTWLHATIALGAKAEMHERGTSNVTPYSRIIGRVLALITQRQRTASRFQPATRIAPERRALGRWGSSRAS